MNVTYSTLLPRKIASRSRFLRPPLAAGYLAAYANAKRSGRDQHDLVDPSELEQLASTSAIGARLLVNDPRVIALSVYVWNKHEVSEVTRHVRQIKPDTIIVLGGPEVAYTPFKAFEDFDVDFVCTGEGEIPFLALLNELEKSKDFAESLPGLVHRRALPTSKIITGPLVENLDDIPSPYLSQYVNIQPGGWVDLETTRGCPFKCRFCLYGKTFTTLRHFSLNRVFADVTYAIEKGAADIYLMDPTFNFPPARCLTICQMLADLNSGQKVTFSTEARAEIVNEKMADAFLRAGISFVEVGLQATSPETLKMMQRSLTMQRFIEGCKLLQERGIHVDIGVIVGLPGDDAEHLRHSVNFVLDNELGHLSVYRLQVLPGSPYYNMAAQLGLIHEPDAPYYVLRTPQFTEEEIVSLTTELQEMARGANKTYNSKIAKTSKFSKALKPGAVVEKNKLPLNLKVEKAVKEIRQGIY